MTPTDKALKADVKTPLPTAGTPINEYEVRGFETARLMPDGSWQKVIGYPDTPAGQAKCLGDVAWLNGRHNATYQARIIVSCEMPKQKEPPLVLDADAPEDIPQEVIEAMINEVELERAELGGEG